MNKKMGLLFRSVVFSTLFPIYLVFAQAPQKMSFQSVVRNSSNQLVADKPIGIRVSIIKGTIFGASVYVETHLDTTNVNGLSSLEIGGGTTLTGSFMSIDWADGPYFIKTEVDPNGGSAYSITGISQLLSVPYALYASKSGDATSKIGFFAKQTVGAFQVVGSSATTIQFNAKDFDNGNVFNTSTGEFTAPDSGVYHFDGVMDFSFGAGTTNQLVLFGYSVNGTLKYFTKLQSTITTGNYSGVATVNLVLDSGDKVRLVAQKLYTGDVNAAGSGNGGNYFTGYKIF